MRNKKNPTNHTIKGCFGTQNKYYLLAAKSSLSTYPFALNMGKILAHSFIFICNLPIKHDTYEGFYPVFYSLLSQNNKTHCLIINNKTDDYQGNRFIKSNQETHCSFQTLSLFEELLYIINKQGSALFRYDIIDYDYLILIYSKKSDNELEIETKFGQSSFAEMILHTTLFRCQDITDILQPVNRKNKETAISIQGIVEQLTIKVNEYNHIQEKKYLSPRRTIPLVNQGFIFPSTLHHLNLNNPLSINYNQKYINYLRYEVDEQ